MHSASLCKCCSSRHPTDPKLISSSSSQISTRIPHPSKSYSPPFPPHDHGLKAGPGYSELKVPPNFLICLHFHTFRVKYGEEHHRVCSMVLGLNLSKTRDMGRRWRAAFTRNSLRHRHGAVLLLCPMTMQDKGPSSIFCMEHSVFWSSVTPGEEAPF